MVQQRTIFEAILREVTEGFQRCNTQNQPRVNLVPVNRKLLNLTSLMLSCSQNCTLITCLDRLLCISLFTGLSITVAWYFWCWLIGTMIIRRTCVCLQRWYVSCEISRVKCWCVIHEIISSRWIRLRLMFSIWCHCLLCTYFIWSAFLGLWYPTVYHCLLVCHNIVKHMQSSYVQQHLLLTNSRDHYCACGLPPHPWHSHLFKTRKLNASLGWV